MRESLMANKYRRSTRKGHPDFGTWLKDRVESPMLAVARIVDE